MKEENYDNLRRALDQLRQYDPATNNWDGIDRGLNKEVVSKVAKLLPSYSPPSTVWNELNGELDKKLSKRRKLTVVYRWSARAAAALIIFGAGYAFATYDTGPKVTYAYQTETPNSASLVSVDWNAEEESFERVMQQLSAIDEPELNALRLELEELTEAKQEVENMLRAYGNDNKIVRQLVEIESERSRVYRLAIAEL